MTAVDDIGGAFNAALERDAGKAPAEAPEVPAPPRRDPAAPHGRAEDGSPIAPYGLKADGTPRLKPAGPGRPKGDEKPRVETSSPASGEKQAGKDYVPGLVGMGENLWLLLSLNQGVSLGKRKGKDGTVKPVLSLPDTRPYAAVFREQLPMMAKTWSEAANQNATVRRYVSKFAGGEGEGVSWVLGVALSSAMFAMGCGQLARQENAELRSQLAAKNDGQVKEYFQSMLEKLGMAEAA